MAKLIIQEVARSKDIKQSHLQISAAVTPPLLYRYWHNKTGTVDLTILEKIAKALGVKPGELIISDAEYVEMTGGETEEGGSLLAGLPLAS